MNDPGPVRAVRRQVRAVRRRSNLHVLQHAIGLWVAIVAAAATVVVLSAVRSGHAVFTVVTLAGLVTLCTTTGLLARRVRAGWLPARDAPAHIDAVRGLRGRLPSLLELGHLEGRAHGPFFALLVQQNLEAMPSWSAEEMVPDVMPIRVLASAIAALCALAMVVVLAPALRPPAPHAIIGDRRIDFVASSHSHDGADRLLVTPGTERPGRDGEDGGATEESAGALAGAAAMVQDWLQQALGAEEHWESGEPVPSNSSENGARSPQREPHPTTMAAADDRPAGGAGRPGDTQAPEAQRAGGTGTEQGAGGPGAGAGTDTDPSLYGEPRAGSDDEPVAGHDRFELGIAARVRTRHGADMGSWTDAPPADSDRHPILAAQHRADEPGHRMPIPPAFAPLVRRLFAHTPPGKLDPR
jgi:hypothetical protein